jgi:UDPglucose 6-dehydrogenase
MKICVVGSGYVGLVTGACLAEFGMTVTGVDKDATKIAALERGEIPIYEPGLEEIVTKNVQAGRLHFTTAIAPAIRDAKAVFIAVGTPPQADGRADLSFVRQVAEAIGDNLNGYKVVITKSTVPVGTGQMVERIVRERSGGQQEFAVVSNPEFLREGSAIEDFFRPDRVVIGARTQRAVDVMLDIYAPLKAAGVPFVVANVESAEMIKYASNGFLATKVSFVNEVAELCEAVGADVEVVARGMGLDNRIGPKFLRPGPGFGGSCFPKDTRAVAQIAEEHGMRFAIIEAVLAANERVRDRMIPKIDSAFEGLAGKTVAVLGLAFKGDTDDMRESPAVPIVQGIIAGGARVRAYDPAAMDQARPLLPASVEYCADAYDAARGADGVVIATEWNQFRALELDRLKGLLRRPLIVDLRNLYEPDRVSAAGFRYVSVGRPEAALAHPAAAAKGVPA